MNITNAIRKLGISIVAKQPGTLAYIIHHVEYVFQIKKLSNEYRNKLVPARGEFDFNWLCKICNNGTNANNIIHPILSSVQESKSNIPESRLRKRLFCNSFFIPII